MKGSTSQYLKLDTQNKDLCSNNLIRLVNNDDLMAHSHIQINPVLNKQQSKLKKKMSSLNKKI